MKTKPNLVATPGINHELLVLIDALESHIRKPARGVAFLHRVRVDIKRLRAWIRLVRDDDDSAGLRELDRALRDVMKMLSPRRDRHAFMESLRWLEKKELDTEESSLSRFRTYLRKEQTRTVLDWNGAGAALAAVLAGLKQAAQREDYSYRLREGLQRTYKRAAKLGERAFAGKINPNEVHDFRRWAKYLFYQLGFVQGADPELYLEAQDRLDELGRRLGRYHDLVLMREKISSLPVKKKHSEEMQRVEFMIEARMQKLLRRSSRLYEKIFSTSSSGFVRDLP